MYNNQVFKDASQQVIKEIGRRSHVMNDANHVQREAELAFIAGADYLWNEIQQNLIPKVKPLLNKIYETDDRLERARLIAEFHKVLSVWGD